MGIRVSFWAALGREVADSHDVALERVRTAMLRVTDEFGGPEHGRLDMKISEAREIAALWHLRPDLMQLVAEVQGEEVARECMAEITALFKKHHLGGRKLR
ncbi:MAG: hypothetical protein K9K35_01235 [Rhodoferax sp.]|jgi:hypothetical protein|nr:hypothetical protein [Rhodoferax sp.]